MVQIITKPQYTTGSLPEYFHQQSLECCILACLSHFTLQLTLAAAVLSSDLAAELLDASATCVCSNHTCCKAEHFCYAAV